MEGNIKASVLLCTPYSIGNDASGIAIWARNIFDYYRTRPEDAKLEILPMDRNANSYKGKGLMSRIRTGIKDYGQIYRAFKKKLIDEPYDVVHLCTSASISLFKDLLMLRYAKKKGCKTVVHFHFGRIPALSHEKNWEWRLLKRVVKLADKAVTMDMKSYEALRSVGFFNLENIPNPLSKAIIEQVDSLRGKVERIPDTVLFVGHVIPSKGIFELVQAVNAVPGLTLRIVGKCNEATKNELIQLATRDSGQWLTFVGVIPHEEVIKEMLACDIFALPSYTEGFPNVILESMVCGCAIVATPVGAIPEMLQFGKQNASGLMVEVKDVECVKQQLTVIQSNAVLLESFRQNAIARVNEMYAIPIVWKKMVDLWASA